MKLHARGSKPDQTVQRAWRCSVHAVDDVSFTIEQGEFFTLLGPSGCGKTTTLRCVAGLERPQSGKIHLRGRAVFDASNRVFVVPNQRNIGMVFQSYAIWPHLTVFNNVAFPLKAAGQYNLKSMRDKVARSLDLVGLAGFEERPATQLSGGQQQRVALARALVKEPDLLLLDEPLSNLDTKLRERMRAELKRLQRELGITTLYVTHDQMEGILLSDRIAVMNGGRILQLGKPDEVYERPDSQFVADFMGSTNLLRGTLRKEVGAAALESWRQILARYFVVLPRHWLPAPRSSFPSARRTLKSPRKAHPTKTICWKAESKNGPITSAWSNTRSTCAVSSSGQIGRGCVKLTAMEPFD